MVKKVKSSKRKYLCVNDKQTKKQPTEELYKITCFAVYFSNLEGLLFTVGITKKG